LMNSMFKFSDPDKTYLTSARVKGESFAISLTSSNTDIFTMDRFGNQPRVVVNVFDGPRITLPDDDD
jgi:hypothetical protein